MAGVLAITGVDAARSGQPLAGDLLSLIGGLAAAATSHSVHPGDALGVHRGLHAARLRHLRVVLLPALPAHGTRLVGLLHPDWANWRSSRIGAQLLGHTLLNAALPHVGVTPLPWRSAEVREHPGGLALARQITAAVRSCPAPS